MSYTAVSGGIFGDQAASPSATFTSHSTSNFVLAQVVNLAGTAAPTGLTSTNATWSLLGTSFTGVNNAAVVQCFIGVVTSVGSSTVTPTLGTGTSGTLSVVGQEFSSTNGTPVLDVQGQIDAVGGSGGQNNWASLTPATNGELYWGYAVNNSNAVAGSTTGYVYTANSDGHQNGQAYNLNCSVGTATAPIWGDSTHLIGMMVLVKIPIPSVTTQPVTIIAETSATGNGTVVSDNGSSITERGVCWDTSANPTTSSSHASTSGTTGSYSVSMTGLTDNTTYHVRAYAINANGTAYGTDVTFTHTTTPVSWIYA